MNFKRLIVAVIVSGIILNILDIVVHGNLLRGLYDSTKEVWFPPEKMNMTLLAINEFLFAILCWSPYECSYVSWKYFCFCHCS